MTSETETQPETDREIVQAAKYHAGRGAQQSLDSLAACLEGGR